MMAQKEKDDVISSKNNAHKITLSEKLDKIYGTIPLETTCNHGLECCKAACPSMNYSEFLNLISKIWETTSRSDKIKMICTSIEYFFKVQVEKWGVDIFHKPCILLDEENKSCKWYRERPLNCRLYGLWPKKEYKARVEKFQKAYDKFGIKKKDIPLNRQCPYVKRIDDGEELTMAVINFMFEQLNELDKNVGEFSDIQILNNNNYRTFHDWLLFRVFGEEWLSTLTTFMLGATKKQIEDQIEQLKKAVEEKFSKDMPDVK